MTKTHLLSFCFFLLTLLSACTGKPDFNFDSTTWKADLNGCAGQRIKLQPQVEEMRLQLVGLKEHNIRPLFGKPDAEELMERSQKIYLYFLTPGPKCKSEAKGKTTALTVRFDALGTV